MKVERFCFALCTAVLVFAVLAGCKPSKPATDPPDKPDVEEPDEPDEPDEPENADDNGNGEKPDEELTAVERLEKAFRKSGGAHDHAHCGETLKLIEAALDEDPECALAYAMRGDHHAEHSEVKSAVKDYYKALQLDRDNEVYAQKLAVQYEIDGQLEEALNVWQDLCRRYPNSWRSFYGRGDIYRQMGQNKKADDDFERATQLQQQPGSRAPRL